MEGVISKCICYRWIGGLKLVKQFILISAF
jgi:hypothetical protein